MGPYGVILGDPPWHYTNRSANRITKFGGGAMAHYDVMQDAELLDMAPWIKTIAATNCLLALWTTGPRALFCGKLIEAWGFRYTTVGFVWCKTNRSSRTPCTCPGSYTSSSCEYIFFGVRGSMTPEVKMVPQFFDTARGPHSWKPSAARDRLDIMYPGVPKIELFARCAPKGWDFWGDEAGKVQSGEQLRPKHDPRADPDQSRLFEP